MDLGRLSSSTGPWSSSASPKSRDTIRGSLKSSRACRGTDSERMEVNSLRQETECKRGRRILSDDAGLPQNSAHSHKLFAFFFLFVYNRFPITNNDSHCSRAEKHCGTPGCECQETFGFTSLTSALGLKRFFCLSRSSRYGLNPSGSR